MPPDGHATFLAESTHRPVHPAFALPPPHRRLQLEASRSAIGDMRAFLGALFAVLVFAGGLAIALGGA